MYEPPITSGCSNVAITSEKTTAGVAPITTACFNKTAYNDIVPTTSKAPIKASIGIMEQK